MNLVALAGRLTAQPEISSTPSGVPYCRATLAVDRDYKTLDGNRQTDFIDFVCWRQQAEFLTKYFSKGSMVIVQGSLEVKKYDKDGIKRISYSVRAEKINFAGAYRKHEESTSINYQDNMEINDYEELT